MDTHPVVELRVHGVSATPPADLLDRTAVRRVDEHGPTGFYRPADADAALDHNGAQQPAAYLEGYAWGGLTSGAASRALWLLLLPFALANLAPRLRPAGGSTRAVWALLTLARLHALGLTATFTVAAAGVGLDLFAWQCGGEPGRCASLPSAAAFMSWTPGHRLLLGLVLPLVVLGAVYVLSRTTANRYEQVLDASPDVEDAPGRGSADEVDPGLAHPWLWRGDYTVRRQRSVHLQVGLLAVVVLLSGSLADPARARTVLLAALATIALGAVLLALPRTVGRRPRPPLWWLPRVLWVPTAATIALVLWPLATDPLAVRPDRGGALQSYDTVITALFAVQLAVVVLIGAVVLVLRHTSPPVDRSRQYLLGVGTVLVAALASVLGAVFSAGVYLSAANWLARGEVVPDLDGAPLGGPALLLPPSLQVTSVAFLAAAVVTAVSVLAVLPHVLTGWRRSARNADLLATYPDRSPSTEDAARDLQIRKIFWRAGLVDSAPALLTVVLGVLALGSVAVTALVIAARWNPQAEAVVAAVAAAGTLDALGAYVIIGLLALLAGAAFVALRVERTRRVIGILWDLMAFWPRAVHPLAPPCYAERTVPELLARLRQHVGTVADPYGRAGYPTGAVVLAGHSQGSVIAAATVLQLDGDGDDRRVLDGLAVLTYGSVLRRLYSRYFPAYFGLSTLDAVAGRVAGPRSGASRWRNLWRLSDQLGGPVEFDPRTVDAIERTDRASDRRLVDPPYRPAGSRAAGHSGFSQDPGFQEQVAQLAAALPAARLAAP